MSRRISLALNVGMDDRSTWAAEQAAAAAGLVLTAGLGPLPISKQGRSRAVLPGPALVGLLRILERDD